MGNLENMFNLLFSLLSEEQEKQFKEVNDLAREEANFFCENEYHIIKKEKDIVQKIVGLIDICCIDSLYMCRSEYREKAKRDIEVNLRSLIK